MAKRSIKSYGEPHNYYFWLGILKEEHHVKNFLENGDKRQVKLILATLLYLKGREPEIFEKIEGKKLLKLFKKRKKDV